jgi:DNA invertase Pin-like site-specific DNA recombinase
MDNALPAKPRLDRSVTGRKKGTPNKVTAVLKECILHELQTLSCGFVSLGETWCDTTTDVGRLMLTIMGGIAEFERGLIRKRCDEGIERAKVKGVKFGRPAALDAGKRRKIAERYAAGETMANLAAEYECGEATIWRALH